MTETTQDGADVVEQLSFSVRTADGVTILDFHAGGCRPATSSEIECLRELTRLRAENEALKEALGATRAEVAEILKNIIECRAANFVGVAHPRFDEESQKEIARLEALLRKADGALQQGEKLEETSNG